MTNPAEKIRQVVKNFVKHNTEVHAIKFSIFPRTHEKRRKEFYKYLYKLDKQYQQNLTDCYREHIKQSRTSLTTTL